MHGIDSLFQFFYGAYGTTCVVVLEVLAFRPDLTVDHYPSCPCQGPAGRKGCDTQNWSPPTFDSV